MSEAFLFNRISSVSIGPENSPGVTFSGLRMSFNVMKSVEADSNKAKITIFNISETSRNLILKKNNLVVLNAGYTDGDESAIIFAGHIANFTVDHGGVDVTTEIESIDGGKYIENVQLSLSYGSNSKLSQILGDIARKLSVSSSIDLSGSSDVTFKNPVLFSGEIRPFLDNLCIANSLKWSFQNNRLKVLSVDKPYSKASLFLTKESGLIGSPERELDIDKKNNRKKDNDVKIPGWIARSLLYPKVEPGEFIQIQCKEIPEPTPFKVYSLKHVGDTHGKDWYTELKVQVIDGSE